MTSSTITRQVAQRCSDANVRYTRGRQVVVDTLAAADGPMSAAELHDAAGGALPLSSIYRSLAVLEDAGVLAPHHGAKGLTRYELAEWLRGHHHHLVCVECGSVEDVEVDDDHEQQVDEVVAAIGASAAFTPVSHVLEIEGRCAGCH